MDGPTHQYSQEEDAIRQAFLESLGFVVVRFTNLAVLNRDYTDLNLSVVSTQYPISNTSYSILGIEQIGIKSNDLPAVLDEIDRVVRARLGLGELGFAESETTPP